LFDRPFTRTAKIKTGTPQNGHSPLLELVLEPPLELVLDPLLEPGNGSSPLLELVLEPPLELDVLDPLELVLLPPELVLEPPLLVDRPSELLLDDEAAGVVTAGCSF